ncbi:hypothetical protein BKA62DRAFT_832664 [Auriculariales sp. MPI-PUGE-AT-0066]|nr:hypothetical protein BKA62DRAFT_832664 [Auriculariales sp. MPI-PUGE-AT-0066]
MSGAGSSRRSLGECPEGRRVTYGVDEWFTRYTTTRWTSDQITFIRNKLQQMKLLDEHGWTDIRKLQQKRATEDDTLELIEPIARAVAKIVKRNSHKFPDVKPSTVYESTPHAKPSPAVNSPANISDATSWFLHLESPSDEAVDSDYRQSLRDLSETLVNIRKASKVPFSKFLNDKAALAEFKREDGKDAVLQNERQLLAGAALVMYSDPRRLWINSMTIEKNSTRFWQFNRGHIAVTTAFNLHDNPDHFIRYLLFVGFGTLAELGLDETVTAVWDDVTNTIQHIYKVDEVEYRIDEPLSTDGAYHILSHAPRVYTARKLIKEMIDGERTTRLDNNRVVLKDSWPFIGVPSETDVQTKITNKLKLVDAEKMTNYATEVKQYLMDIQVDWVVESKGILQKTPDPRLRDERDEADKPSDATSHPMAHGSHQKSATRDEVRDFQGPTASTISQEPLKLTGRIHRRIVYNELCETVYEIKDFRTLCQCLIHVVEGLKLFRYAGFVHRDISDGNCLWHPESRQGKIADLEYSKEYANLRGHDPITGTPEFMAVEYQAASYLFLRSRGDDEKSESSITLEDGREMFLFNYYHDLESVMWVHYHYFLTHVLPISDEELKTVGDKFRRLKSLEIELFNTDTSGNASRSFIISVYQVSELRGKIRNLQFHGGITDLAMGLDMNAHLRNAYIHLEDVKRGIRIENAMRWPDEDFQDKPYNEYIDLLNKGIDMLPKVLLTRAVTTNSIDRRIHDAKSKPKTPLPSAPPVLSPTITTAEDIPNPRKRRSNADPERFPKKSRTNEDTS